MLTFLFMTKTNFFYFKFETSLVYNLTEMTDVEKRKHKTVSFNKKKPEVERSHHHYHHIFYTHMLTTLHIHSVHVCKNTCVIKQNKNFVF